MTDIATPLPAPAAARPLVGVGLVVGATGLFAVADVLGKHLMTHHPIPVVQAGRYLVNTLLLLIIFLPRYGTALWQTNRTGLVGLRALLLAAASLTMGLALQRMPVGETVAIVYLAPFLVMLAAGPLLGERVGLASWCGAALAFLGVLLVVRPGSGLDPWGVFFALTNAVFGAGYHLLTRVLSRSERMTAMLFHVAIIGAVVFSVLALPALPSLSIPPLDLAMIGALGALATFGHFLFTAAYREAPASLLAPVNYLHIVWATLLGWGVFTHAPDAPTLLGMGLVLAAGVIAAILASRKS